MFAIWSTRGGGRVEPRLSQEKLEFYDQFLKRKLSINMYQKSDTYTYINKYQVYKCIYVCNYEYATVEIKLNIENNFNFYFKKYSEYFRLSIRDDSPNLTNSGNKHLPAAWGPVRSFWGVFQLIYLGNIYYLT